MIQTPSIDWFALSPVLVLLAASGLTLLEAVLIPRELRKPLAAILCAVGFAGALLAAALVYWKSPEGRDLIAGAVRRDRFCALAQMT